jgi:hypothetical protein
MIHKQPSPYPGHVRIVFELPACLWADRVFVVGDFNRWEELATPLHQARNGVWRASVDLPAGSQSQFRYRIDGEWKTDYHADGFAQGGDGEANSVVQAVLPLTVVEAASLLVHDRRLVRYPQGGGRIELDGLARDKQPGAGLSVGQQVAQLMERLPQTIAGALVTVTRPEALGQCVALMGLPFHHQIGQQRPRLVGGKRSERRPG